jgi:formaldehyde-activating enzyme involved in methanogenesis
MFITKILYEVECNNCHRCFAFNYYDNKEDIIRAMKKYGWIIVGEKHYCSKSTCKAKAELYREGNLTS